MCYLHQAHLQQEPHTAVAVVEVDHIVDVVHIVLVVHIALVEVVDHTVPVEEVGHIDPVPVDHIVLVEEVDHIDLDLDFGRHVDPDSHWMREGHHNLLVHLVVDRKVELEGNHHFQEGLLAEVDIGHLRVCRDR